MFNEVVFVKANFIVNTLILKVFIRMLLMIKDSFSLQQPFLFNLINRLFFWILDRLTSYLSYCCSLAARFLAHLLLEQLLAWQSWSHYASPCTGPSGPRCPRSGLQFLCPFLWLFCWGPPITTFTIDSGLLFHKLFAMLVRLFVTCQRAPS